MQKKKKLTLIIITFDREITKKPGKELILDKINCVEEIEGKIVGHEIYQNSNNANCYQNERDIKIPRAQKVKRSGYKHSKYQRRHG